MFLRVRRIWYGLACALLGLASPAAAQRVAVATAVTGGPSSTVVLDLVSGQTRRISDEPADQAFFTADGSVLIWHPSGSPAWRATVVDAGLDIALPLSFVPSDVVHPRTLAVFGTLNQAPSSMARLDAAGLHVFTPCGTNRSVGSFDLSPDGAHLLVICRLSATDPSAVIEIDILTGVATSVTVLPSTMLPFGIAVTSPDHYLIASSEGSSIRLEYRRRNDGQVLVSTSRPFANLTFRGNLLSPNPRQRARPAITWCSQVSNLPSDYTCRVEILDAQTLSVVSTLQAGGPLYPAVSYGAAGTQALMSGVASARLVDIASGQALAAASAPTNGFIVAAWGAEPQAPTLAAPVVAGGAVSFAWTLPTASAAVTTYRLEAGYAPGTPAVSLDLGPATATTIPGVPPGRYYARLRAVNANGVSAPSAEVVIDVP